MYKHIFECSTKTFLLFKFCRQNLVITFIAWILLWINFLLLGAPLDTAIAAEKNSFRETYEASRDFKAIARAFSADNPDFAHGQPVLGFSWQYDTAAEAVSAAKAYCRQQLSDGSAGGQCKIIMLGDKSVNDVSALDELIEEYEKRVISRLQVKLHKTGKRELITRLSTIYQKTGEYALSERLLYELAMQGEHLAQNALAYHWAELEKNLSRALALVESAISQNPDFFSYHDTRALVLLRLGRTDAALRASSHAVQLRSHPIALDHYGDVLWLLGRKQEAKLQWKRAVDSSQNILFVQRLQSKINNGMSGDIVFE